MNHHLYSDLLFENPDDLSVEQGLTLREHMQTCEECRNLSEAMVGLETAINRTEMLEPEPGFVSRWETRLAVERLRIHKIQTIRTMAFFGAGFLALAGVVLYLTSPWLLSPDQILWTWIYQYFSLVTSLSSLRSFIVGLYSSAPALSPLVIMLLSFGLVSELIVLWIIFYRLITNFRRVSA